MFFLFKNFIYSENSFLTQNRSKCRYISSKNIFFTTFVDTKTKSANPNRAPPARLFQKLYNMSIPLNTTLPPTGKHLLVNLRNDGIYFATFDPLEDDTYQSCTIDFTAKNLTLCENVKNSIYENPQLLQEYDRTYLLVDTPRFTLVPEEMETCEENCTPYYDFCYPGHNDYIVENRLTLNRAYLLFGLDRELYPLLVPHLPGCDGTSPAHTAHRILFPAQPQRQRSKGLPAPTPRAVRPYRLQAGSFAAGKHIRLHHGRRHCLLHPALLETVESRPGARQARPRRRKEYAATPYRDFTEIPRKRSSRYPFPFATFPAFWERDHRRSV